MDYLTSYINLIILIKILFILTALTHVYLKIKGKENSDLDKKVVYWKEKLEFLFIFLMALFLIYLFNPRTTKSIYINGETKLLLYLFGVVLLITADWNSFIHESKFFIYIQQIIGKN